MTPNDIDSLRREWQERDRKLETAIRINSQLLRETYLEKNRAEIDKLGVVSRFELIAWIPCIILLGFFNAWHFMDWKFFIPGVLLQAWVTFMPVISIRQRAALRGVDYSQPVVKLQRKIETLKMRRMFTLKWALLIGQVLWFVPFLIVFFKGMFGVNLYAKSDWLNEFMLLSVACGVLLIPVAIWVSTHIGRRWQHATWFQKLTDNLAGRDMMAAREFLKKLKNFEIDAERSTVGLRETHKNKSK